MKSKISDKNQTVYELTINKYTQEQLNQIEASNYSYQDLDKKYPAQCVRESDNFYRVVYTCTDNRKLLILNYDKQGGLLFQKQVMPNVEKKVLASIALGVTVDDVKKIDESGEYLFLYTGSTDTPKVSTHYTIDGFLCQIEYDTNWKVVAFHYELI